MLKAIKKSVNSIISVPLKLLDNSVINAYVKIGLVMFASIIAPHPPTFLLKMLKRPATKLLVLTIIAYTGIKDPILSLLIAISFMIAMMALHRIETTVNINKVLRGVVDIPQKLLHDSVDLAQDALHTGGEIAGIPAITGITNSIVDKAQSLTNMAIDGLQDAFLGKEDEIQENFTMADRVINVEVPEIGKLDGLDGSNKEKEFAAPL